ncbi:hypothetical protein O0L34_g11994 [Tuta absoluta]|nr:hypothetical protein O0L34_g11994 [Tuta absoluta]
MSLNEDLNIATQKLNKLKNLSVVKTSNIKKDVILESTVQDSNEKQKDEVISTEEFSIRQYRLAVKVILANSNATAISHHNGKGYKCCFCANQYADPAELKQHNLDVHIKDINRIGNKVDSKAKLMVKLDITKLTCNICQQEIATIDQLIQHLNDKHKKKVLVDIKKFILPFKFINDELRCIFCTKIFHTFKMLQTHMNSHYSNYTCELCSKGFVTRTSLMKHKFSHSPTETVTHEKVDTVKPEDGKNRKSENILACHCPLGKRDIQTNSNASVINKKVDTIKLRDNKNRKNEHILVYHWQSGIRDILSNSNATVIGGHQGTSFKCDFCTENFFLPSDLKQHNIQMHAKDICHFRKYQIKSKIFAKLDISDLRCNLCEQETSTIAELVEHLNSDHYKDIKPEIVKYILPFKFNGDELRCCVCSQIFHTFKSLQYHMHSHFSNFICKVCSAGFVARNALALHIKTHEIGSVKCSYCSKTFNHLRAKKYHEEYVHTTGIRKSVCRICNARFRDYRQKKIHLVRVHGVGSLEFKCQSCDKVFATSYGLLHHTNNFHLMMRPHQCPVCSKSFYSQPLLKNHLLIHTGEKEFQCDICSKRFVRKTTLVEHMKIHMNDRRHKCELCGQAFVQKCSLKGHMRSRHGTLDK